jgi:hypothetical protein
MAGRKPGTPKTGGRQKGSVNKVAADVRALARLYTEEAVETLAQCMRKAKEWSARAMAAKTLLERGWGAPKQDVNVKQAVYVIGDRPLNSAEWATEYAGESPSVEPAGRPAGSPRKLPAARSILRGSKGRRKD